MFLIMNSGLDWVLIAKAIGFDLIIGFENTLDSGIWFEKTRARIADYDCSSSADAQLQYTTNLWPAPKLALENILSIDEKTSWTT